LIAVSTGTWCVPSGGTWGSAPCPTANLVGTCQVPGTYGTEFTGVNCSPSGVHLERYYAPTSTTGTAQAGCKCQGCSFIPP
jgi:hypothetical protein